jgi:two-component system alkaline phosphatase synthesis response regulator PhoP
MAKKILIIDDELELVKAATVRLKASGYEVISVDNGQEGIGRAEEDRPDLILLDIIMPKKDGYAVCKKLKSSPKTQDISIIIFTASGQKDLEKRCLAVGADGVIKKPFETTELLERVNKLLQGD